ncbi:L,D-transpeptidase family protein [Altererythrobacter salegens]|uniref:L,D-transpeptidase family protein n=1 Tax=Croceibacterium salegens TaxID=1737568 RepID=A0A6I4SU57_9SPHN|nr:L,D-transpeptidase family protein [Croceibacterium salegens]MXO59039.1 L,D-transpeptidase family protein [Croceibacterium salegens]
MTNLTRKLLLATGAAVLAAAPAAARQQTREQSFAEQFAPFQAEDVLENDAVEVVSNPVIQGDLPPAPQFPVVQPWSLADAQGLLDAIEHIDSEGLDSRDYRPDALRQAIAFGASPQLDQLASEVFGWLVEDLRDGRTPMEARKQWFVVDPDPDLMPTGKVLADALASHDIAGTLAGLDPTNPDYAALKVLLAATPASNTAKRKMIRANMDRWRWLARDLGGQYLITNVPEMQLRLTVNDQIIRTYKTIVGKPGRTATPQLAETVEGVIFNPTWTVPQSIVKGEGLGARVLGNPGWAKSAGYVATRGANGYVSVVQQPGPSNSLGMMKLDMPNPHAIFLHDTPSRGLFNQDNRALSHGCIRTERALELAMTIAILGQGATKDEAVAISTSRKYTRVPVVKTMPVYITYFTMGRDIDGNLRSFNDIYGRDAPVLAALDQPRVGNRARVSDEKVIEIVDDLQDS